MRKKAWMFQVKSQVEKHGENASWYVGYVDPTTGRRVSKSMGSGAKAKRDAERTADRIHSQIVTGTFQSEKASTWEAFRKDYEADVLEGFSGTHAKEARASLNHFERLGKPGKLSTITTQTIDRFRNLRLKEKRPGKDPARATVSKATVNKDLRYIRMALKTAEEWGLISRCPKVRLVKELPSEATFISQEEFSRLYAACGSASKPEGIPNVATEDWWKAFLVTAYLTGWRLGQLLGLTWEDVELETGEARIRADVKGNKGKRESTISLHPLIVEHLRRIRTFSGEVFPWPHHLRTLYDEFAELQRSAGITPRARGKWYGFHDLRRGFATETAGELDLYELMNLMQHRSLETTKRYVNMAKRRRTPIADKLSPPNLKPKGDVG